MYLVLMYLLLDLSYVPSSVVVTSAPPFSHLFIEKLAKAGKTLNFNVLIYPIQT